jgi:Tfp pilus assembly protein PilN
MRPVNLIPPEERRGDRAPLRAGAVSYAIVGVLAAALLGVVVLVMTGNKITEKEGELASLEVRQDAAEQRVRELAPYGEFATLSQSRRETISSLAKSRFDWERVLNELALVIPDDVWLESLTGAVTAGISTGDEGSEAAADSSITGPSLQITGCANGQVAVARFLASLRDIDGVTRVGMQKSALGDEGGAGAGATPDAAAPEGGTAATGGCQTRDFIAAFEITVAFDAVPAPTYPASSAVPAATSPATPEQQAAEASAAEQSTQAQEGAETVGVGE